MRFLYRNYIIFISLIVILINSSTNTFDYVYGIFHTGNQKENFIPYENSKLKINIQYPSNWQKEERLNDFVTFIAPIGDIGQYRYPAGLGISSINLGNVSLETIKNVHIKNMTDNLKDFQLIESSDTVLVDKRPAKKIIFTATDGEVKRQSLQLITKNNDKIYLFTYKADVDQYDKYFPTIQTMLNSIIFLK
jgi:PsbP-like protein